MIESPAQKEATGGAGLAWLAAFAVAALAFAQRRAVMGNSNVAWLLTAAEKWLDGARLYVDVLETNPPFSIWMYAPAVAMSRLTGLRAESWVDISFIALAAASLWWCGRFLRVAGAPMSAWTGVFAFAVLALLPAACFGEREHLALILVLPPLAVAVARAAGASFSWSAAVFVGGLTALLLCIKPHFGLAVAAAAATGALLRRTWRPLFAPEHLIAGALFAAYAASTFALYPAYWDDVMPVLRLLYLPMRAPFRFMLHGRMAVTLAFIVVVAAMVVVITKAERRAASPPRLVALAAAAGFFGAAVIQGKGWPYHFYPAFGLLVIVLVDVSLGAPRLRAFAGGLGALALSAHFFGLFNGGIDMSVMQAPMRALKQKPRVNAIVSDFAAAFPAVREVGGSWTGRAPSAWVADFAMDLARNPRLDPRTLAALRDAEETYRRQLAADIRAGEPDILMVELRPVNFLRWTMSDAELAALLACYRPAGRHGIDHVETGAETGHEFEVELYARAACADGKRAGP